MYWWACFLSSVKQSRCCIWTSSPSFTSLPLWTHIPAFGESTGEPPSIQPQQISKYPIGNNIWFLLRGRWQLMPGWRGQRSGGCWWCDQSHVCAGSSLLADSQHKYGSTGTPSVSWACLNRASLLSPSLTCCRFALKNPCDRWDQNSTFWKASLKTCGL